MVAEILGFHAPETSARSAVNDFRNGFSGLQRLFAAGDFHAGQLLREPDTARFQVCRSKEAICFIVMLL
ncbi:MAG: hypothetical protein HGB15_02220 [Chlorobaculum sp.]|nr:hypothetical protein [Chlorobaculum sp.]